jgi:hypothetical protein
MEQLPVSDLDSYGNQYFVDCGRLGLVSASYDAIPSAMIDPHAGSTNKDTLCRMRERIVARSLMSKRARYMRTQIILSIEPY